MNKENVSYLRNTASVSIVLHTHIHIPTLIYLGGCPRGVMVKAMESGIVVSEYVLQSRYYVQRRRVYQVVALLLKPSLGLFGFVGRCRVLLPHPGSGTGHLIAPGDHHTFQHIQVHFGVDFQADFEDVRWHDVAITWNHTKDHNRNRKLCFHHPGYVPVIRGNPDLHFEGAGNDPDVITWIGREHELYSGASPISLVEHCVTFRHDTRLLSLWVFVHNWPTSRWSETKKRKPVFIKRKWNHVIFSRATILSFHPVYIYIYIYKIHSINKRNLGERKKAIFFQNFFH